jgi:hypothetical protein
MDRELKFQSHAIAILEQNFTDGFSLEITFKYFMQYGYTEGKAWWYWPQCQNDLKFTQRKYNHGHKVKSL